MMKKPPAKPVAKGGVPTPEGAKNVPGSENYRRLQKAPHPGEIRIGRDFVANPKGSAPLVVGKKVLRIEGDRPRVRR